MGWSAHSTRRRDSYMVFIENVAHNLLDNLGEGEEA